MGGFAALRNEPNLGAEDGFAKTNPTPTQPPRRRMPLGGLKIRTQWVVFAARRNEPNLAAADGFAKTNPTPTQPPRRRMPLDDFENTNPMGGFLDAPRTELQYLVFKYPWADASNTLRRERIGA
jgi:hypothetical protein